MKRCVVSLALGLMLAGTGWSMTVEERREYLRKLMEILPESPPFTEWLAKSNELPPDFDAFPRVNGLPDAFQFLDGRRVRTHQDWVERRREIRELFEKWGTGSFPPKPKLDRAEVTGETRGEGYLTRDVTLHFGPESKASMRMRVVIPDGAGRRPVLIGTSLAASAAAVLRRGYISVGYAASDGMDDVANLREVYPQYDFAALPRRAWAVQPVIDYLETLPEVDMDRIGITGYSRNGKMATIAAMLDDRISALIAGSTGVGGVLPWRYSGERNSGEGIESTTRMFPTWFVERIRFFSGREDRFPVDANLLMDLIAPRSILIQYGLNDEVANTWGNEAAYYSSLELYKFLGAPERIGILRTPGFHGSNDQEKVLDWLDIQFGRSKRTWNNDLLFPWDWNDWRENTREHVDLSKYPPQSSTNILAVAGGGSINSKADWEKRAAGIRESVQDMLGEQPLMMPVAAGFGRGGRAGGGGPRGRAGAPAGPNPGQLGPDVPRWVIQRNSQEFGWTDPARSKAEYRQVRFGYNVTGDLYYPAGTPGDAKLPTVIYLHGYSYPLGYMWVYRRDVHPVLALVEAGYAVLAFDQSGFGSRMEETRPFYDRYPRWSRMGRMVEDVRKAIDTLQTENMVDPERIYTFGYSVGGAVGLYAAALDSRIKGVVSVSGFTPMRTDRMEKGTGGVARYSHERGLLPKLGFFVGHEAQIPYDYDELMALVAPRPVYVLEPQLDRDGDPADVRAAVDRARRVFQLYGAADKLNYQEPWDYTRLPNATQDAIIRWMSTAMK